MPSKVRKGSQNFSQGWVTVLPAHLLDEGSTPNVQNVDFSRSFGRLTKRKGYSVYVSQNTGTADVCGLFQAVYSDGTERLFAASNDDVYEVSNPGTWTSRFNSASMNGAETNFAVFDDLCVFVNVNITTQKIDVNDAASSALGGTPPSNAKYIEPHRGRLFIANTSAGTNRLHFSALDNAEDWTTAGNAGFIDVGVGDGDIITGIKSIGSVLFIFKKWSTWALFGNAPTNFTVRKISASVGCVANKSIVVAENFLIFLGHDGVYAARADGVSLISHNIKPTIEELSDSVKSTACAGKYKSQYWLCIDADADGENDEVYYLDYVLGVWGRYTNKKEKVFCRLRDGSLMSGGDDLDVIRKHDDTNNDNGVAINMVWDTKDMDFDEWVAEKGIDDIMMVAKPIANKTLTISYLLNGILQGTTKSFALDPASTEDKVYLQEAHFPISAFSAYIRFRFSNAETDAPIEIYGYDILGTTEERVNG